MNMIDQRNWNEITAAHLLNRTCFTATPDRLAWALGKTPAQVVDELVDFDQFPDPYPPPPWTQEADADRRGNYAALKDLSPEERKAAQKAQQALHRNQTNDLRGWWLNRMMTTPRPLQENLTLFWHGHFATSIAKVRFPYAMYLQNETLRRHAAGNWKELLYAIARDPAMLIYLDNAQSRRRNPNENFARELMELFTLGEGHYTEEDIRESARSFTGFSMERDRLSYLYRAGAHDAGEKTFMGDSGTFTGDDIIDHILRSPQAARFITRKLMVYFMGIEPDEPLTNELAEILEKQDWNFRPLLKALFLSKAFYAEKVLRTHIKSPVDWLVGAALQLERPLPPAGWCQNTLRELGQELFAPPNVKGWDGGYTWINTTTLTARHRHAFMLVQGGRVRQAGGPVQVEPANPKSWISRIEDTSKAQAMSAMQERFFPGMLSTKEEHTLLDIMAALPEDVTQWKADAMRRVALDLLRMPSYQLT